MIVGALGLLSVFFFAKRWQIATDRVQQKAFLECAHSYIGESVDSTCEFLITTYPQRKPKVAQAAAEFLAQRAWTVLETSNPRAEKYKEAGIYLDRALLVAPETHYAIYLKGILARNEGELGHAGQLFRQAIRLEDETQYHVMLGATLAELGDVPSALAAFDEAMKRDPTNPHIFKQRQAVLIQTGDLNGALDDVNELQRLGHVVEARQLRHIIYLKLGRHTDAYDDLEALTVADDASALSWMLRAVFEVLDERYEDAIASARAGLLLWPDNISTDANTLHGLRLAEAGAVAKSGDSRRAAPLIAAYLAEFGDTAKKQWYAADFYHEVAMYREAVAVLRQMDVTGDAEAQVLRRLAWDYCHLNEVDLAFATFQKLAEGHSGQVKVLLTDMSEKYGLAPTLDGMELFIAKVCAPAQKEDNQ